MCRLLICKHIYSQTSGTSRTRPHANKELPEWLRIAILYCLMATKPPHPVVTRLKAWRVLNNLSQSKAVRILVEAGLPVALTTLQQWEIARSSPRPLMVAALARFLVGQEKLSPNEPKKPVAPVIESLKAWRKANNLSQSQAVEALVAAGLPAKLKTLQGWESGRHSPQPIAAAALARFLDQHSAHPTHLRTPPPRSAAHHASDSE